MRDPTAHVHHETFSKFMTKYWFIRFSDENRIWFRISFSILCDITDEQSEEIHFPVTEAFSSIKFSQHFSVLNYAAFMSYLCWNDRSHDFIIKFYLMWVHVKLNERMTLLAVERISRKINISKSIWKTLKVTVTSIFLLRLQLDQAMDATWRIEKIEE